MPGSSWITDSLPHKQTRASPAEKPHYLALCLCQSLPAVHDHRWGTEQISTCKLNNSSLLFYHSQSISLFKNVKAGELPTLLFACKFDWTFMQKEGLFSVNVLSLDMAFCVTLRLNSDILLILQHCIFSLPDVELLLLLYFFLPKCELTKCFTCNLMKCL